MCVAVVPDRKKSDGITYDEFKEEIDSEITAEIEEIIEKYNKIATKYSIELSFKEYMEVEL